MSAQDQDPLLLLREYVQAGRLDQVTLDAEAGLILFGSADGQEPRSFPRDTPTAFKQRGGEPCLLDAVWFRAVHADVVQFRDYFHKCKEAGIGRIPTQQAQDLVQWLQGRQRESEFIDFGSAGAAAGAASAHAWPLSGSGSASNPLEAEEAKLVDTRAWGAFEIHQQELAFFGSSFYSEHDFSADLAQFSALVDADAIRHPQASASGRGGPPKPQASSVPTVSNIISRKRKDTADPDSGVSSADPKPSPAKKTKPNPHRHVPIILVPDASTALLNIFNVVEFLGGGAYATAEEMKARGVHKQKYAVIKRASVLNTQKNVHFHVYDNPELLSTEDWDRVVAVFAHGPKWQFDTYPFDDPAELFSHICGFHLHYDDESPHNNISKWKVNLLSISKTRRYQDRSVVLQFWNILQKWIQSRNHVKRLYI